MYPGRRPPRKPRPPSRPSALPAGMVDEWADRPLGGGGQLLPVPAAPAPPAPPELVIPPPPWAGREAELALAEPEQPAPDDDLSALDRLKLESGDGFDPPRAAGPVEVVEPLTRPQFPPPDWRLEEKERARAARDEHALAEELPGSRPPRREAS
jgi:hypothetical protein